MGNQKSTNRQAGVIHLVLPLILLLIIAAVVFTVVSLGIIKNPFKNLKLSGSKGPVVSLQTQYQNPFDKSAQYVNPFSAYKNPFDSI